jgi:hypothetical protein
MRPLGPAVPAFSILPRRKKGLQQSEAALFAGVHDPLDSRQDSLVLVIDAFIQSRNFLDPSVTLCMLHLHDVVEAPVKMVGNKGYLLIEGPEGVA